MHAWVVLSMASALIATAPGPVGAAESPCPQKTVDLPLVDVILRADCTAEVEAFGELNCFWGTVKESKTVGPVTVSYYRCAPPEETAPASGPCPAKQVDLLVEGSYVSFRSDCTASVVLFPEINCVGPWIGHVTKTVGPVTVDVTYCKGPSPPPE